MIWVTTAALVGIAAYITGRVRPLKRARDWATWRAQDHGTAWGEAPRLSPEWRARADSGTAPDDAQETHGRHGGHDA